MPHNLTESRKRIQTAFDPKLFHAMGRAFNDAVSAQLERSVASEGDVLPWRDPESLVREASALLDDAPPAGEGAPIVERFDRLIRTALAAGHNLHDPRYIGHQVPAPVPSAGWFDALGAITNQCMAVYEMGPFATAAEHAMVDRLGREIGWTPGQFAGLATHGGSLANLTALLTARNVALGDAWSQGMASAGPAVLVAQADAHYSVARAAGVLGLGAQRVVRAPLDDRRRMDPVALDEILAKLAADGTRVVAVCACACATPIGAFDPLRDVAEVSRRHGVWLHVDAAHGGAALLSETHRPLLDGIELADSVAWDAHKMLFTPALCAFVLYRDRSHRFEAFQQEAPYLFDPTAPGLAEFDSGLKTLECTKRGAALGLWGLWAMFGRSLFRDLVDVTFAQGRAFHAKLVEAPDFEPVNDPQCNIVVFRHIPAALRDAPPETLGRFQMELRRTLIESGEFYIVSTRIDGVGALRAVVMNPLTEDRHIDDLLAALRRHGKAIPG